MILMKPADFLKLIEKDQTFLIITSRPLDFDCIGSGLILKKYLESLGKEVNLMFPRKIEKWEEDYYNFLPYFKELKGEDTREILSKKKADVLILLDGTNLVQFYDSEKNDSNPPNLSIYDKRIHIDHHLQNPEGLGTQTLKDAKASSTTEIILREILPQEFIDQNIATLIYAAIVGDTGNFRWNFNPETLKLSGELLEKGAEPLGVVDKLFFSRTKTYLEMLAYAIENSEYHQELGTSFLFLPYQKLKDAGLEGYKLNELKNAFQIDVARTVKGYPRGIMMREEVPGKIHITARGSTFHNQINMPKMFMEMGGNGGGHFNACAVELVGNFEGVKEKLLGLIKKYLQDS